MMPNIQLSAAILTILTTLLFIKVATAQEEVEGALSKTVVAADWAHQDLELSYTQGDFEEGLKEAKAQLARNPKDIDLYWHVGRFLYEVGERYEKNTPGVDKEAIYEEMLEVSNRGLQLNPDHPHLLFARGIAMGRLGTTRGVIASLFMAEDLESDWLRVAESRWRYSSLGGEEVLPCDAYSALGILYRLVPDWWIIEVIAGMRGSLAKSLAYLQTANDCSPDRIEIVKEYAVIRICYGQQNHRPEMVKAGLKDLHRMLTLPPHKPTDHTDLKHGQMLIDEPKLACAYSRDGQAESNPAELGK
jgi:tetratricopeptide (TPR) repeat protein